MEKSKRDVPKPKAPQWETAAFMENSCAIVCETHLSRKIASTAKRVLAGVGLQQEHVIMGSELQRANIGMKFTSDGKFV